MDKTSEKEKPELGHKELRYLREELWIVLPFFIFALFIFLGSFRYVFEARTVPMLIGFVTTLLAGMRLFHIIFPKSKIGQFKEAGLAGEFDSIREEIEGETLKGKYEEGPVKETTFREQRKAFFTLIGCFFVFLLFGYLVGIFFVIVGTSYCYGYRAKAKILISLVSMYLLCYVVLYRVLGAPADFGLVLGPILESLELI